MQGYVSRMVNFKKSHDQVTKASRVKRALHPSIGTSRHVNRFIEGTIPPPFLVFAVVESLLASRYASNTWLVDGEADAYCAAAAAEVATSRPESESTIFTSDSDLVLFDFPVSESFA